MELSGFNAEPEQKVFGCDFFRLIEFAKAHVRTGALGQHLLYFFVYLHDFVGVLHLQMRKTNTIELQ
jgi:hypothetical protein